MYYYEVVPKIIVGAGRDVLTYHHSATLGVGQVVEVPVGKKQVPAIVVKITTKPKFKTREITRIYDKLVLPKHLVDALFWLSDYYKTPVPTVLQAILPTGIHKNRRCKSNNISNKPLASVRLPLNKYQEKALNDVKVTSANTVLLHGITGSGKTNIYIKLAQDALASQKSAIILVPEIALTSQLVGNFSKFFDNVVVLHSNQTEAERHINWERIMRAESPLVVIGPRSAIFAPVRQLGLVVIDEAHEPSYKQEQAPKYNTLRLASFLAKSHGFKVVFGTATPLIADYYLAQQSRDAIVTITESAVEARTSPDIHVVNLTSRLDFTQHRFLSNRMIQAINHSLEHGKQVLVFHNRRGSASLTVCGNCGWQALCKHCHAPLTLHSDAYKLICHVCGKSYNVLTSCPVCQDTYIVHKGIGTKLIESEISKLWPKANIARFDGDTPKELTVNNRFSDIQDGKTQILIGTQVLAKGLDLPNLETVGVVQADANLFIPDFSSEERVFQLLSQVIGRVGRSSNPSKVIIQTYRPTSEAIQFGIKQNYASFYNHAIKKRRKDDFPPFSYLLKLSCTYKTEATAIRNARKVANLIGAKYPDVKVFGPAPSFYERRGDYYRWQVIVKSKRRASLLDILGENFGANWQYDIDPSSLL
ncbi:MAG: primosomal protein N' [Candidatus Nomurabacteria bacterium]|jgi:primosomal protein N' (replication factor Y)|nr:primosomal protein N' [Candidatus Nomurabacteria bacterium]